MKTGPLLSLLFYLCVFLFCVSKMLRKGDRVVVLFFGKVRLKIFKPVDNAQQYLTNVLTSQGYECCLNFVKLQNRRVKQNQSSVLMPPHTETPVFHQYETQKAEIFMSFLALNINNFWTEMAFSCLLCHHLKKNKQKPKKQQHQKTPLSYTKLALLTNTLDTFARNALNIICGGYFRNLNFSTSC